MATGGALHLQAMGAFIGGGLPAAVPLLGRAPPLRAPFSIPLSLRSFAARISEHGGHVHGRVRLTASAAGASAAMGPAPRPPPHFSDLPLDRSAHLRRDSEALQRLMSHPDARMVVFFGKEALVAPLLSAPPAPAPAAAAALSLAPEGTQAPDGGTPAWILLTWHPQSPAIAGLMDPGTGAIFLGLTPSGAPFFACRVHSLPPEIEKELEKGQDTPGSAASAPAAALVDVRSQGQRMTGQDAAVLALATGILQWHSAAAFCARTGSETTPEAGGHARRAAGAAGATARRPRAVYPRVDPAVIVGVIYGEWLLLGRKKSWDKGRFSLLAGFAETGESLEGALVREVVEESGVFVIQDSARYHSSQPWPFPQSLMVGFLAAAVAPGEGLEALPPDARAAGMGVGLRPEEAEAHALPAVHVDVDEMEDVRWFHCRWLRQRVLDGGPSGGFRIPGKYALANRIITDWLIGDCDPKPVPDALLAAVEADWTGAALPDALIDEGVFKYVLLRVSAPGGGPSKLVVRGDTRAAYHNHIFTAFRAEAAAVDPSLEVEVLGGGRIKHYSKSSEKMEGLEGQGAVASVYGYSAAYGPAPHEVTAAVLLKANPFLEVSVSYDGY